MGLDTDLVKFKKEDFDRFARQNNIGRWLYYFDGNKIHDDLVYYRKHYEVQDMLMAVGGGIGQCFYAEMTKRKLETVKRLAFRKRHENPEQINKFIEDLSKILKETNFETEVIAHIWIS